MGRARLPPNARGGVYHVKDNLELEVKVASLSRRIEEMKGNNYLKTVVLDT